MIIWTRKTHLRKRTPYCRQPKCSDIRSARTFLRPGSVVSRKIAHFDREVIPERRMHAKGSGAFGTFTVTNDISEFTRASIFSEIRKTDSMSGKILNSGRRARSSRRRTRYTRIRYEILHRSGKLGPRRQQHPCVFSA